MAITLKTDYRKTLGLPGYSSHSFSASVEVEISNINDAPHEIQKLYEALQTNVDLQIQTTGYVPPTSYGMDEKHPSNANQQVLPNNVTSLPDNKWKCSDKQQGLILNLIDEKNLTKQEVELLANELFSKGVRFLNKQEASGLIERLFKMASPTASKTYQQGGRR